MKLKSQNEKGKPNGSENGILRSNWKWKWKQENETMRMTYTIILIVFKCDSGSLPTNQRVQRVSKENPAARSAARRGLAHGS